MENHENRARELLAQMTIDEKIAQLCALWIIIQENGELELRTNKGFILGADSEDPFTAMKHGIGQLSRPLGSQPVSPLDGIRSLNKLQKFLVTETRLGIPALPHEECLAGLMAQGATLFPANINNGSMWDPDLMEKIAKAIGDELYSVGSRHGLSPVLDVNRDARWGRNEECFGEDPYLCGVMACAYVRGLQDPSRPVLATLKHFVGHSFSEGARNHAPVRIGPNELQDTFLLPFEMAVKLAKAHSLMPAYHDLDGEPMHQSIHYLQKVLREQWGFDGIIVSDYEGIAQLFVEHKTQPDIAAAAAAALRAGVDVELPGDTAYREGLKQALDRGDLDMTVVDQAVLRHLIWKFRLGLFDKPYVDEGGILPDLAQHDELAYRAAVKSIILLKNNGILPLADAGKVALVGPLADNAYGMLGGYSFPVHLVLSERKERDTTLRTLRNELSDRFGENLVYRKGCDILSGRPDKPAVFPGDVAQDGSSQTSYISTDESGFAEALDAARNADTVIMAVGDLAGLFLSGTVGEGSDASSLELPGAQRRLAEAVLDLGKPTIVIMFSGRPYNSGTIFERANAVIQAWLPGQRGAGALADIMTGTVNPEGRLSVSIPHVAGAMPYFYNHKRKSPGTPIQQEFGAAYPFGFGLSYTTFAMDSFAVEKKSIPIDGDIRVSLTVANTGKREGDELVQVYIRDNYSQLVRPVMELKAFQRVTLASGQKAKLSFCIPSDMLQYTGRDGKRMVEGGTFDIMIGTSSRNILFRETVTIEGSVRYLESDWKMLSTCDVSYLN